MMEKQQTAVEWLYHKLQSECLIDMADDIFEQAKQMEREQIEKAYNIGEDSGCSSTQGTGQLFIDGKDYYTQTYGQ